MLLPTAQRSLARLLVVVLLVSLAPPFPAPAVAAAPDAMAVAFLYNRAAESKSLAPKRSPGTPQHVRIGSDQTPDLVNDW